MSLNDRGLRRLTQDLEQVVIADEVKPGKAGSFLFQEFVQTLLATLQPIEHGGERALDGADPEQGHDPVVPLSVGHDHPEVVVDFTENFPVIEALKYDIR